MLIHISKDGKTAKGLYDDKSPLRKLGRPIVTRASHVEFDNEKGKWFVYAPNGGHLIKAGFEDREAALRAERALLEAGLLDKVAGT